MRTMLFKDYVKYCEGIALDVEYLDLDKFFLTYLLGKCKEFPISTDKIDIFYNLYIDGDDIEDIEYKEFMKKFLTLYIILDQDESYMYSKSVEIMKIEHVFSLTKYINDVTIRYSKPELLESIMLQFYDSDLPNIVESLEYLVQKKNILACELLALRFVRVCMSDQEIQDVEKYRYYAEIAYRK